ncbi:MAG TPA: hypothetical protein VF013_03650 [Candidatus Limnocylindria bacterium]
MWLDDGPVSPGVLDHQDQSNRCLMLLGEKVSLPSGVPVLRLEVLDPALNLHVQELVLADQQQVDGMSLVAGSRLEDWSPRVSGYPDDLLGDRHLTCVAKPHARRGIRIQDEVQTGGRGHREHAVKLNAHPTILDSLERGPCHP